MPTTEQPPLPPYTIADVVTRPDLLTEADLPASFGRFELLSILGQGGMGRVFRARMVGHSGFRKQLAVKVIHRVIADQGGSLRQALIREAYLGGLLHHPNVVDTYDFGEQDGQPWIAMELLDGLPLNRLIARVGRVPPALAVELGLHICAGLDHAHTLEDRGQPAGLVHRDLKPSNVILTRQGQAKVMDFGTAKVAHLSGNTTATGMTKGTPAFMSPEQMAAEELDARSDLFAFGSVLYELLTGRRLFDGDSIMAVMMSIFRVDETLQESRKLEVLDGLHPGLRTVIESCLNKEPDQRPDSARELQVSLRRVAADFERGLRLDEYVQAALAGTAPWLEPLGSVESPAVAPPTDTIPSTIVAGRAPELREAQRSAPRPRPVPSPPPVGAGPTVLAPAGRSRSDRSRGPLLLALLGGGLLLVGLLLVGLLVDRDGVGEPVAEAEVAIPDLPVSLPGLASESTAAPTASDERPPSRPTPTSAAIAGPSPVVALEAPTRIRVGEATRFAFKVSGFEPSGVALRFRPAGGTWQSRQMRQEGDTWVVELVATTGMEGRGSWWVLARRPSGAGEELGSSARPFTVDVLDEAGEVVGASTSEPHQEAQPKALALAAERQVERALAGERTTWTVGLTGEGGVSVSLRLRPEGGAWQSHAMEQGPAGRWSVTLVVLEEWRGTGGFFFHARGAEGASARLGSPEAPFPLEVR